MLCTQYTLYNTVQHRTTLNNTIQHCTTLQTECSFNLFLWFLWFLQEHRESPRHAGARLLWFLLFLFRV